MENIYNFNTKFLTIALCICLTNILISCHISSSEKVISDTVNLPTENKLNEIKDTVEFKNEDDKCLNAEYPKREKWISAGVMNAEAIDIPKPEYPAEAKSQEIEGEIIASVIVDEKGKVIWAKVNDGHSLLQEAVRKVVCKPRFKPATISGIPYAIKGLITYRFSLTE
ncbi:MAG: energy transducer TonB [Acidobacteriota bacterium]|jgi:TonB family protein|nr:energy transducer TonB [Acidobacteriota bacterium]